MPKKKGRKKGKNRASKPQGVVREAGDAESNKVRPSAAATPPALDKAGTDVTATSPAVPEAEADAPFFDFKPTAPPDPPAPSTAPNVAPENVGDDKKRADDVISDAKRKVQEQAEKLAQRRQRRTQNGTGSETSARRTSDANKNNAAEDSADEDPLNYSYASTIQRDAAARSSAEQQQRQAEKPPNPPSSTEAAVTPTEAMATEFSNAAASTGTSAAAKPKSGAKHEPEMATESKTDVPTPTLKPPKQASAATRRAREKHELNQAQSISQSRAEELQRAADTANRLQSSQMVQQLQRKILAASYTARGPDLEGLFARLVKQHGHQPSPRKPDAAQTGTGTSTDGESLTLEAFGQVVQKMLPGMLLPPQLRQLVATVDADGDGIVSVADFVGFTEARKEMQGQTPPRRMSSNGRGACTTPGSAGGEGRRHSMPDDLLQSPKSVVHSPAERVEAAPGDDEDGCIVKKWQQKLGKSSGTVARSPTMDLDDMVVKLQRKLLAESYTPRGPNPGALFQRLDRDSSGVLSLEQFGHAVQRMLPGLLGARDMKRLRTFITTNKHGHVGQAEFVAFVQAASSNQTNRSDESSPAPDDGTSADSVQEKIDKNSLHERLYNEAFEWKKAHDNAFAREEAVSGSERLRRDGLKSIMRNPTTMRGSPQHQREIGWGRGGTVSGGKIDRLESWRVHREREAAEKRLKPRSRATVESIASRLHEQACIDDRKRKELEQQASRDVTFKPTISKASQKMVTRTTDTADAEALLAGGVEAREAKERREKRLTDRLYSEAEKRRERRERETLKKKQTEEANLTFQPRIIGAKSSVATDISRRRGRAKEARACKRLYKQGVAMKQRKKQEEQAQTPPVECTFKPKMHTSKRVTSTVQHVASGTTACDRLYANAQKLSQKRKQREDRAHRERLELLKGGSPSSF